MPTGRRDSAGDGLDLTAGASSSSDETSTDCKDSAYVSSEGLPLMGRWQVLWPTLGLLVPQLCSLCLS